MNRKASQWPRKMGKLGDKYPRLKWKRNALHMSIQSNAIDAVDVIREQNFSIRYLSFIKHHMKFKKFGLFIQLIIYVIRMRNGKGVGWIEMVIFGVGRNGEWKHYTRLMAWIKKISSNLATSSFRKVNNCRNWLKSPTKKPLFHRAHRTPRMAKNGREKMATQLNFRRSSPSGTIIIYVHIFVGSMISCRLHSHVIITTVAISLVIFRCPFSFVDDLVTVKT